MTRVAVSAYQSPSITATEDSAMARRAGLRWVKDPLPRRGSGALVEPRQHQLAMAQGRCRGGAAVGGAQRARGARFARLVRSHLLAQQAGDIHIDVLAHRAHGAPV